MIAVTSIRTVFIAFMTQRPPFDNLDLRKAVIHAIDRQSIVDSMLSGYGEGFPVGVCARRGVLHAADAVRL